MFSFGNPGDVWYVIIPILIVTALVAGAVKKNRIMTLMKLTAVYRFRILRWSLMVLGLGLIFVALMGPRQETGVKEIKGEGLDIYVLIDTSKSMLATDIVPSRLDRAKKLIDELMPRLEGDRIGFIPYASSAYIQMPLTDDYNLAKMFLNVIDTDMMGGGGTDVAQAVSLAADSFGKTGTSNQVMLILSDGEEHDVDIKAIEKILEDSEAKIYSVGIGTAEGSLIPVYGDDGVTVKEYKKDETGELVMSRLDESLLSSLASVSGGKYYRSSGSLEEVDGLISDFEKLQRAETAPRKIKEYRQLFQWFLGLGILSLLVAMKLPERRQMT